jgi:hypothetical protein
MVTSMAQYMLMDLGAIIAIVGLVVGIIGCASKN